LSTKKKHVWSLINLINCIKFDHFSDIWSISFGSMNTSHCSIFDKFHELRQLWFILSRSTNFIKFGVFPLSILINSVYFDEFLSNRFILSKFHHFLQNYSFSSILISSCQIWSIASNLLDIWSISSIWMNFRQIGSFLSNLIDGVKLDSFVTFSQFHEIWCFFMKFDELRLLWWIFVKLGHFCKFNQFRQTRQFWLIFVTFEQFHQIWSFPRHLIQFVYFDECSVNLPIFVRFDRWRQIWFILSRSTDFIKFDDFLINFDQLRLLWWIFVKLGHFLWNVKLISSELKLTLINA
jgi:hypothetical protein